MGFKTEKQIKDKLDNSLNDFIQTIVFTHL